MRCSACQATLPDGAQWCGQCFTAVAAQPPSYGGQPTHGNPAGYGAQPSYGGQQAGYGAQPSYGTPAADQGDFFGQPTSNLGTYPQFGVPGGEPVPATTAAAPARNSTFLVTVIALVAVIVAAGGWWFLTQRDGGLTVGAVSVDVPAGWDVMDPMAELGDAMPEIPGGMQVDMRVASPDEYTDGGMMLMRMQLPVPVTIDELMSQQDLMLQGMLAGAGDDMSFGPMERVTVDGRDGLRFTVTAGTTTGSAVLIMDGTDMYLVMLMDDSGTLSAELSRVERSISVG